MKRKFPVLSFFLLFAILASLIIPYSPTGAQNRGGGEAQASISISPEDDGEDTGVAFTPLSATAAGFAESRPVRDMPEVKVNASGQPRLKGKLRAQKREKEEQENKAAFLSNQNRTEEEDVPEVEEINQRNAKALRRVDPNAPGTPDAALSSDTTGRTTRSGRTPEPSLPTPSTSFEGVSFTDTQGVGQGFLPPDPTGAIGPNHYVQAVNSSFRVWDRAGNALTPVLSLGSLWATIPGPCANSEDGDPIVFYDQLADRWVITQFCVDPVPSHQLFAVSKTSDPTGAYYLYDFVMPNTKFNDYPKFGLWPNAYFMTNNQFPQVGAGFLGGGNYAFDRKKMLAGDSTANYIYFDTCPTNTGCVIGGMLPANLTGFKAPPAGAPGVFAYFTADEFADPQGDAIRLFDFHADFNTPANSTFTERTGSPLAVAAFDPRPVPNSRNVVPQPAGVALDVIGDRLMMQLSYRNFGTHEALSVNHSVNAAINPVYRAGVRVYQLRRTALAGAFTIDEQQTFAGAMGDTTHRWMGSAAQNSLGDLVVAYSASSATVFPSLRYAARFSNDPAGTGLAQGEETLIAGSGAQQHSSGRWGDYSHLTVDPTNDCTFWYTGEYYFSTGSAPWRTRIAAFTPRACAPLEQGTISGTVTNCDTGLPVEGALVDFGDGFVRTTDANGNYSASLPPGTYNVSITAPNYSTSTTNGVVVTDGSSATVDGCLTGTLKLPVADGKQITAESCNANGEVDPNETVTVNFGIRNSGTLSTTNLVATLQATGGVTNPSAPQSYGVVVAGGATVTRPFTFTAGNVACGATITATMQLQDGATDLGTITYTFTAGQLQNVVAGTGNISTALPDNSTVDVDIPIASGATINDVNVSVRMNHTFTGDVRIDLVHPDGTLINLVNRRGSSGDNFGTGANSCAGTPTVFDDQAATLITAGAPPYAGSFRPEGSLAGLNGKTANGTWKVRFNDNATGDPGLIGCVTIEINRRFVCCGALPTAVPPPVMVSESVSPANGAPDPEETVTMNFPIRNLGGDPTTNLVATLQATGGVHGPSAPQNYGAIAPDATVSRPFTFTARGNCGDNITATFALQDGALNLGTVSYTIQLGGTAPVTQTFSNSTSILIPGTGTGATTGAPGNPYPSNITVSGLAGTVSKVTVTLTGLTHTWPNDIDMLLVGPGGQKYIFLSDAIGSSAGTTNRTYTFDDAAATQLPTTGHPASGTYRPVNVGANDPFPAPAPAGPYSNAATAGSDTLASVFNGTNPNGTWSLYIVDDTSTDSGTLAGGWSLSITAAAPVCQTQVCSIPTPANVLVNVPAGTPSTTVNYPAPSFTGSCGVVTSSPASGSVFPAGNTTVNVVGTRGDGGTTSTSFTVRVNTPPTVSVTANPNTGLVAPATSLLEADAADPNGSVTQVEFFDGMTSLGVDTTAPYSFNYTNISAGVHTITAVATDGDGVTTTSASIELTVAPASSQGPTLIISEFRLHGLNGANDEFIEIYNNSDLPHTVSTTDGSGGYALAASDGVARFVIPNGTVIPARGHYLGVNSVGYSLGTYPGGNAPDDGGISIGGDDVISIGGDDEATPAPLSPFATGDATYTTDIPVNAGIALFNTSNAANFTLANRLDAVGSVSEANTLYKEGTGYPNINGAFNVNYSLYRDLFTGLPKDTNNNEADFILVDTNGTNMCASTVTFQCQRLGAPGPENLSAPIARTVLLPTSLIAPCVAATVAPNRVRDTTGDPGNNSTLGTLDIRRRFTNVTGSNVTRLRFRIVDITTFPVPSGTVDFRARTSTDVVVSNPCTGTTQTVRGTTLEEANSPADQPNGGGYNSTLSAGVVTLATPLASGESIDVRFLLGVQQSGAFRFFVIVEALP